MNDDFTSTSAAAVRSNGDNGSSSSAAESTVEEALARIGKRVLAQTKRKSEFVHDMIFNLDLLIYAELCVLYYMDCWFFAFVTRAFVQAVFLSPKLGGGTSTTKHRPFIVAILGSNAICLLAHLLFRGPEAGELSRGYLHGGVIIDFIGQKGPISKPHFLVLDLLVTALQCFLMAVHMEQDRLKIAISATESSPVLVASTNPTQDIDAEERGVRRDATISSHDIELQELGVQERPDISINDGDQERLLSERATSNLGAEEPLDLLYSGNAIVADFHVLHTIRLQWEDYGNATATALHTVGASAEYNWVRANRQFRRLDALR